MAVSFLVHDVDELDDSYSIREGHLKRAVGERMKVFEEFVSLFDDQDCEEEYTEPLCRGDSETY